MGRFCSGKGALAAGGREDEGARAGFCPENPLPILVRIHLPYSTIHVNHGMETEWGGGAT